MALTRKFKDLVKTRVDRDPKFRAALLQEAVESFIHGDIANGKAALRSFINATVGFTELGEALDKKPQSLMRMLSPAGNPTAENLFAVIAFLQQSAGVKLNVARRPAATR